MEGDIACGESRIESLRRKIGDFKGIALSGQGHALGNMRRDTMAERRLIGMRDNDKRVHVENSCEQIAG
jgi:hypothetical protein